MRDLRRSDLEQPNAALVRRLYEARDRNDEDAIRSVLSENVLWHEPDAGGEHTGPAAPMPSSP